MKEIAIFAIPGFLGLPKDWEILFKQNSATNINAVDIFTHFVRKNLWEWAEWFNGMTAHIKIPKVLIGYSLGGRLAMHALLQNPDHWQAAMIISAHPGLKTPDEKKERLLLDNQWAQRFDVEPWESLMKDWNSRSIFQNDPFSFERQETDYSRSTLSHALNQWSLGRQDDLQSAIEAIDLPILWMTGSADVVYSSLANRMQLKHPFSKIVNVPESGHRVPWQQPEIFHKHFNQFLKKVPILCKQ